MIADVESRRQARQKGLAAFGLFVVERLARAVLKMAALAVLAGFGAYALGYRPSGTGACSPP